MRGENTVIEMVAMTLVNHLAFLLSPISRRNPVWQETGNAYFPFATLVKDQWWVLRVNNFPDHPLITLFVGGRRRFDLDAIPRPWQEALEQSPPRLSLAQAEEALKPISAFEAYGSEAGRPCDNPFCCGALSPNSPRPPNRDA